MVDKAVARTPISESSQSTSSRPGSAEKVSVALVGGKRILRSAIRELLNSSNIAVSGMHDSEESLAKSLDAGAQAPCNVVLLILSGVGPFGAFRRINETLGKTRHAVPLVVLSERASRGQVYAALRIGARGYVNLDADPRELTKAINLAARNKVYLAPDAAELLVNDLSSRIEPANPPRLPNIDLSKREVEIVQLLCEGLSSKQIAGHLHISAKTVENHRYNIYRKCEVDSIAALMRHAIQHGLVSI